MTQSISLLLAQQVDLASDLESRVDLHPNLNARAWACPPGYVNPVAPSAGPALGSGTVQDELNTYKRKHVPKMAEPRARAARQKGQLNFGNELKFLLHGFGSPALSTLPASAVPDPLPETLRVLDEITTDFIIETCHAAASVAAYSRRQKIKVDDFKFVLRKDPAKLGRVQELFRMDREIKKSKKLFNVEEVGGVIGKIDGVPDTLSGELPGKKGKGRKRREREDGGEGGKAGKKSRRSS